MYYLVKSDRLVTVDFLGVLEPGVVYEFTEADAAGFTFGRGIPLINGNVPEGVEVVVVVSKTEKE